MEIKKGNLNFDQTGRAYPDNPHIKENWDCIWEHEDKYYKLVGDINNKEWEEAQLGEDPKEETIEEIQIEKELMEFLKYIKEVHVDDYGHLEICDSGDELDPTVERVVKEYMKSKNK
jgi:hypothetical protein